MQPKVGAISMFTQLGPSTGLIQDQNNFYQSGAANENSNQVPFSLVGRTLTSKLNNLLDLNK